MKRTTSIPVWPLIAAYAAAILVSAATGSGFAPRVLPIAIVVTAILALVFGIPAYFAFRSRLPAAWWAPPIVGFAIGAVPAFLLAVAGTPDYASSGGVVTVQDGALTRAGWEQAMTFSLMAGLPGGAGGLAFWAVLKASGALNEPASKTWRGHLATVVLGLAAIGTVAAFMMPTLIMDRSCHNPMRDGRTSLSPEISARLDIGPSEWPIVVAVMEAFAKENDWSLRKHISGNVDTYAAFQMSACSEDGTYFMVLQHHANPDAFPRREAEAGPEARFNYPMRVSINQPQGGDSWRRPADSLLDRLEERFGDRITYSDGRGRTVPREEAERGAE